MADKQVVARANVDYQEPPSIAVKWRRGPAQNADFPVCDGDAFLVAVRVCDSRDRRRQWWELSVIGVSCDEGYFSIECDGSLWGWDWGDIDWILPIKEILPPEPARGE